MYTHSNMSYKIKKIGISLRTDGIGIKKEEIPILIGLHSNKIKKNRKTTKWTKSIHSNKDNDDIPIEVIPESKFNEFFDKKLRLMTNFSTKHAVFVIKETYQQRKDDTDWRDLASPQNLCEWVGEQLYWSDARRISKEWVKFIKINLT